MGGGGVPVSCLYPVVTASRHPHRLCIQAYGVTLEVRSAAPELLDQVAHHLPFGAVIVPPAPAQESFTLLASSGNFPYRLRHRTRTIFRSQASEPLLDRLRAYLILRAAEHSPNFLFVHAGVVAMQGRALLLPGRSLAGKSTLVAELVRQGATYYSDEFALIDPEGLIHPFAQPLQMRSPGSLAQRAVPVEHLGGTAATNPVPLGLVAFTRFHPEALWNPRPLTQGQAVLELLRDTVSIRRDPARALQTLTRAMHGAVALRSPRGEARICAQSLLAHLAAPEPAS
jgi:hypothetical protein